MEKKKKSGIGLTLAHWKHWEETMATETWPGCCAHPPVAKCTACSELMHPVVMTNIKCKRPTVERNAKTGPANEKCTNVSRRSTSELHFLAFFLRKYPTCARMKLSHTNLSWLLLPRWPGTCIDFQFSSAANLQFFAASGHCSLRWKKFS